MEDTGLFVPTLFCRAAIVVFFVSWNDIFTALAAVGRRGGIPLGMLKDDAEDLCEARGRTSLIWGKRARILGLLSLDSPFLEGGTREKKLVIIKKNE